MEVPTHIVGVLTLEDGALATIVTSFDVWHSQTPYLEVHEMLGSLSVPDPNRFAGAVRVRRAAEEHWEDLSTSVNFGGLTLETV